MRYTVCFVIFVLMLAAVSCSHVIPRIPQNEGIIAFKEFFVSSESTELESYTKGTIYVRENGGKNNEYHVQILAWVEVDPKDWGGVEFAIPFGWEVTGITSSYTNDSEYKDNPADNISVLSSTSNHSEWFQFVRVEDIGGGRGSLIIELDSTSSEQNPWPGVLKVVVGVGSAERDGIQIQYPDWQEIEIPLR